MAVTFCPLWVNVADHPVSTLWPLSGKVNPRVHPLIALPRFWIVIAAVNPPGQSLVVYVTAHPVAACAVPALATPARATTPASAPITPAPLLVLLLTTELLAGRAGPLTEE